MVNYQSILWRQKSSFWIVAVCIGRLSPTLGFESGRAFGFGISRHRSFACPRFYRHRAILPICERRINIMSMLQSEREAPVQHDQKHPNRNSHRQEFTVCHKCKGEGRLISPPSRKARKRHKLEQNNDQEQRPPPRIDGCKVCQGSGLVTRSSDTAEDQPATILDITKLPRIAIIGGGLGGLPLVVASKHRSIPFTVYERDNDFFQRSQGYGLTMQQASRALKALGIPVPLADGIVSTKHIVHTPDGSVVGEWGMRKWASDGDTKSASNMQEQRTIDKSEGNQAYTSRRQNVHIARQSLRFELLKALGGPPHVHWGHKLVEFQAKENSVDLVFEVSTNQKQGKGASTPTTKHETADILVGADGIRSSVRQHWLGEPLTPLRYLGCIVILGICPLSSLPSDTLESSLLDGETVFQTADGNTRIYMMPYSKKECMWQLSFPMEEDDAKTLSRRGSQALKDESIKMCHAWHNPIPPILEATPSSLVSGYPVYDRDLLNQQMLHNQTRNSSPLSTRRVTLLGDACHPMSPFKGQGANQALLDALSLARILYKHFGADSARIKSAESQGDNQVYASSSCDCLQDILESFEKEMLARSSVKVKASAEAARFLHTEVAIKAGNVTRGAAAATATAPNNTGGAVMN